MAIKSRLKLERFLIDMPQTQLAKLTGMTQITISRIETGARQAKPEEKVAIAQALNVSVADLWPEEEVQL
jgi:transcriptional regulator with XRE-family HTH domain